MVVKVVATPCLQWSQPSVPHSPTTMSCKKRALSDVVSACRSAWFGTTPSKLYRSHSFEFNFKHQRPSHSLRRVCSASSNSFSDDEFVRKIEELADQTQYYDDDLVGRIEDFAVQSQFSDDNDNEEDEYFAEIQRQKGLAPFKFETTESLMESQLLEIQKQISDWIINMEMKADSVEIPLSLRRIEQKKQQLQEGFLEAGETAYFSMKTAFSSMVFIIRELHSHTLQIRELLYYEDLKDILARVQGEMHVSFVWLFQQVFSHTPTLMVYLMILLANFTVYSISNTATIAAINATMEESDNTTNKFDSSAIKSLSLSSGGGRGIKAKPMAGILHRPIVPHGVSSFSTRDEEDELWDSMVEEAYRMQMEVRDDALDQQTVKHFVSPVTAKIDSDSDYEVFFGTGLNYQMGLAQDPNNVLLLANYARFLYLIVRDYDRAEEYFKRAIKVEPKDGEAHQRYAHFLWQVRKDLLAAEENFLEAMSLDPDNYTYLSEYSNFLWNTGNKDTCFPQRR